MSNIEIVSYPRNQWKTNKSDRRDIGYCTFDKQRNVFVIELPKGINTKTKLHEIGHAKLGHKYPVLTYNQWADEELDAEIFARNCMGRPIDFVLAQKLIDRLIDWGWHTTHIYTFVISKLKSKDIPISKKELSTIWWYIRGGIEEKKGNASNGKI